jgi:hypothetical protein
MKIGGFQVGSHKHIWPLQISVAVTVKNIQNSDGSFHIKVMRVMFKVIKDWGRNTSMISSACALASHYEDMQVMRG